MTSMPMITDEMVNACRRTGRRGSRYLTRTRTRSKPPKGPVALQNAVSYNPISYNPCRGQPDNTPCGPDCWCFNGYPVYGSRF